MKTPLCALAAAAAISCAPSACAHGDTDRHAFGLSLVVPIGCTDLAIADVTNDGRPDLILTTPVLETIYVFANQPTGTLELASTVNVGSVVHATIAGDLDGDGDADLASISPNLRRMITWRNDGGRFTEWSTYTFGSSMYDAALADVDDNGDLDAVVAETGANQVTILRNDGTGHLTAGAAFGVSLAPFTVAVADLDGDGRADVVTGNTSDQTLSVLRNVGGTFVAHQTIPVNGSPRGLALADVDHDGALDLVTRDYLNITGDVFRNDGSAHFAPHQLLPLTVTPNAIAAGDLTGNGRDDVVYVGNSDRAEIFINAGGGALSTTPARTIGLGESVADDVELADMNGDGRLDIVTLSTERRLVVISCNRGGMAFADGSMRPPAPGEAWDQAEASVCADFDGDGRDELVFVRRGAPARLRVLSEISDTTPPMVTDTLVSLDITSDLIAVDLDADGDLDLATTQDDGTIARFANVGGFQFEPIGAVPVAFAELRALVAVEFNDDGVIDFACTADDGRLYIARSEEDTGSFTIDVFAYDTISRALVAGDWDGDGRIDLALAPPKDGLVLLMNRPAGQFEARAPIAVPGGIYSLLVHDFNGDGSPDLAASLTEYSPHMIALFFNDTTGHFPEPTLLPDGGYGTYGIRRPMVLDDFDLDGHVDLVVAGAGSLRAYAYFGDGTGTFSAPQALPLIGSSAAVYQWRSSPLKTGDINGDGQPDLIELDATYAESRLLLSQREVEPCHADVNGSGAADFADVVELLGAWGPCAGCAADVDDSGTVDAHDLLAVLVYWGEC